MTDLIVLQQTRPTRSDAVRNRALLLETVQQLIAERGVDAVTMCSVAEAAGVGKGTLYRHFSDKAQLFEALLDSDQRDFQERTFAQLRSRPGFPVENLHWFIDQALAFVVRNLALLTSAPPDATLNYMVHPAHYWWRQTLAGLIARVQPVEQAELAADTLYALLAPASVRYFLVERGASPERLRDHLQDVCSRLLGAAA